MSIPRYLIATVIIIAILSLTGFALFFQSMTSDTTHASSITTNGQSNSYSSTVAISYATKSQALKGSDLWTTYHLDNLRTGYDINESAVQAGAIRSAWNSSNLDGAIYAEPLLADGMVFVATEDDSIYALNQTTGVQIWRTSLGSPIPGSSLPCGDIDPSGITGTPVINTTSGEIFAVAYVEPGVHKLFSLNIFNGAVIFDRNIDPSGADVSVLQERGALALDNGIIYIPYGGLDGDCGTYHGWIIGAPANDSGPLLAYEVPTQGEGGIWAPPGPTVEPSGDLLLAVGNSATTTSGSPFDYGNSVILLSPSLQVLQYWAPLDWVSLNAGDVDVGSLSPTLLGKGTVFQSGKNGIGYLLNESNLGGIGGEIFSGQVCDSAFGGTAYAAPYLYVPCTGGLFALNVKTGTNPSFLPVWNATGFWAGPPIIAGGAVWTLDTINAVLFAYSAQSGTQIFQYHLGSVVHFETLTSGRGLLFVADGNEIRAFNI